MKTVPSEPFMKYIVLENDMGYAYEFVKDNVKLIDGKYYFIFSEDLKIPVSYMTDNCNDFKLSKNLKICRCKSYNIIRGEKKMTIAQIMEKVDELETKAIEFYQKGEKELAIFFKNASIGMKKRLEDLTVN